MQNLRVDLPSFKSRHLAPLETDQARHNLILGLLAVAAKDPSTTKLWSLGAGARCALQTNQHNIVLGDLEANDAKTLANAVKDEEFPGCVGPDAVPETFVQACRAHGMEFDLGMPQRILLLGSPPIFPRSPGRARSAKPEDLHLYADWQIRFYIDAKVPDGLPMRDAILAKGIPPFTYFWELDGKPVSLAARSRITKDGATISLVYTPPELRSRGFAGSVTAHASQEVFAEGKKIAFLYTDARNPFSNRAYKKIGYRFHCESQHWLRTI